MKDHHRDIRKPYLTYPTDRSVRREDRAGRLPQWKEHGGEREDRKRARIYQMQPEYDAETDEFSRFHSG